MKKQLIKISLFIFVISALFVACKDDEDTTAPVITLNGANPFIIENISDAYVEPGFTASDDEDGTITSRVIVTNEVNKDSAGTYEIHYELTDNAGNATDIHRDVIVQNTLETNSPQNKGIYAVTEVCGGPSSNYSDTISFSATVNNRIWFTRFANYINGRAYATVNSAGVVTMPAQTVFCGNPAASRLFSGTGSISTAGGVTTMVINMSETTNGTTVTCTETYTK